MFGLEFVELMIVAAVVVIVAFLARSAYIRGIELENNLRLARTRENTKRSIMETRAMMQADMDSFAADTSGGGNQSEGGGLDLMSILTDPRYAPLVQQFMQGMQKGKQAPPPG